MNQGVTDETLDIISIDILNYINNYHYMILYMVFLCFSKVPAAVAIGVKCLKPHHGIKNGTQKSPTKKHGFFSPSGI